MTLPATYREAKQYGSTRYFTGAACKHGHVAPRMTSNQRCVDCLQEKTAEYRKTKEGRARVKPYARRWAKAAYANQPPDQLALTRAKAREKHQAMWGDPEQRQNTQERRRLSRQFDQVLRALGDEEAGT